MRRPRTFSRVTILTSYGRIDLKEYLFFFFGFHVLLSVNMWKLTVFHGVYPKEDIKIMKCGYPFYGIRNK